MILNDKTSSGGIIGRVLYIEKSNYYVYNQRTERIEIYIDKYNSKLVFQLLNAPKVREKIVKQSQGNTQIYVNWSIIKDTKYYLPEINEQKKIGTFFQSIDKTIALHQRKVLLFLSIKTGFLYKLYL